MPTPCLGVQFAYNAHITVYRSYPFVRSRFEQLACNQLLQRQHNAIFAPYSYGGTAVLHRLECVLDLDW